MSKQRKALVIGVSGLSGSYAATRLKAEGWEVVGLSRKATQSLADRHIQADLTDRAQSAAALAGLDDLTDLMICTWSMQANESENVRVNRLMLENLFGALPKAPLRHVALVTGLKHYLGPFEAYASGKPYTPFLETQPRLPGENFYYDQEDVVFAAARERGFAWSVHRPHTMIGYALGNAMNMAVTLAVYASICKETGRPFVFPGSPQQYNAVADVTDARILADQLVWAATTP
jgi:nucleoside-diphosphate-sugar epimerase